eukprot:493027_1
MRDSAFASFYKQHRQMKLDQHIGNQIQLTINSNDLRHWLRFQNSSKKYTLHYNIFQWGLTQKYEMENVGRDPDDDDEMQLDTLIDNFADEDDCEYVSLMKNNKDCIPNLKQYVQALIVDLKHYKAIMNESYVPHYVQSSIHTDDTAFGLIRRIDARLGIYYHKLGVKNYYSLEGRGRFLKWCDDSEYDDAIVYDELLKSDPDYCTVTDFDGYFPFIIEPECRDKAVLAILKRFSEPFEDSTSMMLREIFKPTKNWDLTDSELQSIIGIYRTQLPNICDQAMLQDKSLMKLLAIGYKHNVPYLSFLVDCFLRDQLQYTLVTKDSLTISEWMQMKPCFDELRKNKITGGTFEIIQAAITSYFKCVCPGLYGLRLNQSLVINDSLEDVCSYIKEIVELVYTKSREQQQHCPFQVDTCFVFHSVSNKKKQMVSMLQDKKYVNHLEHIKDSLIDNGIQYLSSLEMGQYATNIQGGTRIISQFNKFTDTHKYKGVELREFWEYPRNKRIVVVVDRGKQS